MVSTKVRTASVLAALSSWLDPVNAVKGTSQMTGGNISGGTCMFTNYTLPAGIYGSTMAGANWDSGLLCGACLNVESKKGSAVVMVVDECPSCPENRVNLYKEAFVKIGEVTDGTVNVEWNIVSCNVKSPIILLNKTGSSKYWFEMQVRNCNQPVSNMEVSADQGKTWQPTDRKDYNYFQKKGGGGFGTDEVLIRITCMDGKKVITAPVGVKGDTSYPAAVNC